jgi:lipoprotein NlpD
MDSYWKINRYISVFFLTVFILSCASPRPYQSLTSPCHISDGTKKGTCHTVKKGETLWMIANTYGVSMESLIKANKLSDPNKIIVGQELWVPMIRRVTGSSGWSMRNKKAQTGLVWPVRGEIINHFARSNREIRPGIDIAAPLGSDIVAVMPGKVIFSGDGPGTLGKMVIIDHSDGLTTIYANNLENLVSVDQQISRGERIARVGTPLKSYIPALHFEIRKDAVPYNPLFYLPSGY